MKYLNKEKLANVTILVGGDIEEGVKLMLNDGYAEDELMSMTIDDILYYYDEYYKPTIFKKQ